MNKKFACPICGYIHEGETAPERCPQCKQVVEWNVLEEGAALNFVTEHVIGIAKGTGDDMIKDLNAHFMGEATEVGKGLLVVYLLAAEGTRLVAYLPREDCWVVDILNTRIAIRAGDDIAEMVIEDLLSTLVAHKLSSKGVVREPDGLLLGRQIAWLNIVKNVYIVIFAIIGLRESSHRKMEIAPYPDKVYHSMVR